MTSTRKSFSVFTCLLWKHIGIVFDLNFVLLFDTISNVMFLIIFFKILWLLLYKIILSPWWASILNIHAYALLIDFIFYEDWTLFLNKIRFVKRLLKYIFVLIDNTILFFLQIIVSICALIVSRGTIINTVYATGNIHVSSTLFGCAVVHLVGRFRCA